MLTTLQSPTLQFDLPPELEAGQPPEARGLARDQVRLMVSHYRDDRVYHTRFDQIPHYLQAGDVVVINTSGTMNAALPAQRADGTPLELHLSTRLPADIWSVELRRLCGHSTTPFFDGRAGEQLSLPGGGLVTLLTPHNPAQRLTSSWHNVFLTNHRVRLWLAVLQLPLPLGDYLSQYGFPIRYSYVTDAWPISYYQTVYTNEIGSAEMPSAGRAFTPELITQLVAKGVQVLPLILHTGVASVEEHERPYEEYYRVPAVTATAVNQARQQGKRIIAVGTTVIRALETVTDEQAVTHAGTGWTDVVITPQRGIRAVNGLLTGLHEPEATHLAMLETLCGRAHLRHTYQQALAHQYLWHEFGDLHLILP
ncbi:MAG: S-adenosylmethionine:tRNA ribosyltransferase-isomerase [Chloroflexi bacterium]|nr:S-adenosylmethionine:tRNA ribosyltransferase-isomerase [Ardenticatenaceae bacterium]MBL1128908.1 S-adenosylmethionine:tRNA ribosyltransferase-isomerase [Chloroflexota bacterium]NOG34987.1 S-adenosylmethionine:tRNA ribosyltransferase-isomerase [Chloroflexota bacterium]GIK55222.1 MAG: queuosine biosynthesis protein [Chloroflexota bacterium]